MTTLFLLLISRQESVDSILQRYVKAMRDMPSFEAHLKVESLHRAPVTADLLIDGQSSVRFSAKTVGNEYLLAVAPSGYREMNSANKTYEEFPYPGRIQIFQSKIDGALDAAFPAWVTRKDLRPMFPKQAKLTRIGEESVSGHPCDHVQGTFAGAMGSGTIDIWVAKSGPVYRLKAFSQSPRGTTSIDWTIASYKPLRSINPSRFAIRIPDGYMPRGIDTNEGPAQVGSTPNLAGWVDPSSKRSWSRPQGKPILFVLAGHDSLPSRRAVASARGWQSMLGQKGVTLVLGSDADSAETSAGLLYNPGRKSVQALEPPETPMFYLIDSRGKVQNLWMGFVPGRSAALLEDVLKAASSLK